MTMVAMTTLELEPITGTIYEHRRKRCEITYIFALYKASTLRGLEDILSCWVACR